MWKQTFEQSETGLSSDTEITLNWCEIRQEALMRFSLHDLLLAVSAKTLEFLY